MIVVLLNDTKRHNPGDYPYINFKLKAPFQPSGYQPDAVCQLVEGNKKRIKHQVLGITSTCKSYFMPQVIPQVQRRRLVMVHRKIVEIYRYLKTRNSQLYQSPRKSRCY